MPEYIKKYLTFEEQVDILESRGLAIVSRERAVMQLKRLGYYRLSAYWYPFRKRDPGHVEGMDSPSSDLYPGYTLDDIVAICDFDRRLRIIL